MTMNRVRVTWNGVTGLPGISTFYVGSGVTDQAPIRTFFDSIKALFPSIISFQVANTGDQLQEATGQITGGWAGPSQAVVNGGSVGSNFAAPTGMLVKWLTTAVVDGRRPVGKTYLVPIDRSVYDINGTPTSASITTIQNAATALIVALAGELKVWHRKNTKGAGIAFNVLAAQVPDKVVVLRSRRD
jgi:hypothetical protein